MDGLHLRWYVLSDTNFELNFPKACTSFLTLSPVGTLGNEEGGLTGPDEFGQKYVKYQKEVSAFHPNLQSLKRFVGLAPPLKIE